MENKNFLPNDILTTILNIRSIEMKKDKIEKEARKDYNNVVCNLDDLFFDTDEELLDNYIDTNYYFIESKFNMCPYNVQVQDALGDDDDLKEELRKDLPNTLLELLRSED
tara:strand:- start:116 stop:445 length:330 start_codon:yes stop_codon:yes gene_type:complete